MTIDEKLQHFMDVTTEKVNAENAKQMQEYEQGLEKVYEDYKETALRKSELALKLLRELDEKLSSEVKGKLERYMATSAYETYLVNQAREIVKFADGDDVTVYIDPEDICHKNAISAGANVAVTVSEYSFGGGVRAVISKRGILIDQSFDTKLKEAFDGKEASLRWKTR